jgi:hypothetical protein
MSLSQLRWTRRVVAAVVVLDLLALFGAAFHRTTLITSRTLSAGTPVVTVSSAAPTAVLPAGSSPNEPAPRSSHEAVALPGTTVPSAPSPTPRPVQTYAPQPDAGATLCPLPLESPSSNGGLQSLIGFAPVFGPFTSEAFAPAAAYAPVLTLVGPVLAQYPTAAPVIEPLVTPLLEAWEQLLAAGYGVVGPYYSPYRAQFIDAETQLATALAPYSQSLASSVVASCIIDLQYTLIAQAPKS